MHPTADRLLDEALRLFAERGYAATTVGQVEAASGLVPRRGALYRHFASKRALPEAAVERHVEQMQAVVETAVGLSGEDLRARLIELAQLLLAFMEATRQVTRVVEREGDSLPALRDRFRDEVVDAGFRQAATFIREWTGSAADDDALGVAIMGSVVAYKRAEWTFAAPPLDVNRDRFLATWADGAAAAIESARAQRD